jgi:hypothetical protein
VSTESPRAFLGIDPGPTTGLVLWVPGGETPFVVQCNARAAATVLVALLSAGFNDEFVWGQIERWVTRKVSAKAGANGARTRELIADLSTAATRDPRVECWRERSAAEVKPWASDERLDAAGLLAPTKGMPHARDAARHALFTAVRDGGVPDPLSTRSRS